MELGYTNTGHSRGNSSHTIPCVSCYSRNTPSYFGSSVHAIMVGSRNTLLSTTWIDFPEACLCFGDFPGALAPLIRSPSSNACLASLVLGSSPFSLFLLFDLCARSHRIRFKRCKLHVQLASSWHSWSLKSPSSAESFPSCVRGQRPCVLPECETTRSGTRRPPRYPGHSHQDPVLVMILPEREP